MALTNAFFDTLQLLFVPFDPQRWVKLSIVCLFLGGGASSAAFHWSLGTLPLDLAFGEGVGAAHEYLSDHPWLIALLVAVGLALALGALYVRAFCRFLLVDTILTREVQVRRAWAELATLTHSYFRWLLGVLVLAGATLAATALVALPLLRPVGPAGPSKPAITALWAALVLAEVLIGFVITLIIILTDDLGVPIMYAERLALPAAWRVLWRHLRAEPETFALYVLLRLIVAVGIGVTVLLLLFPALVAVFSGAVIVGALVVLMLRLVGLDWVWNPATLLLAALAFLLLSGLVLLLLSLVGMPGQVFLQSFGIRFIGSRVRTLEASGSVPQSSRLGR